MPSALIAGATGLVGSTLLHQLLATPAYHRVTALVRRPLSLNHPRLDSRVVDFDALSDIPPCDDVFCVLGTTIKTAGSQAAFRRVDLEYPFALALAARAQGAQFLLVSSVGADANSRNFYLRTKGELENALRGLGFPALHIFRPSLLLGHRAENRPGERVAMAIAPVIAPALVGSLRRYRPIAATAVARAMVVAAQKAEPGVHIYHFDEMQTSAL
ncbi:MAG TPA: NAD(P)H-binding protein [Clostridia bacterium]|nr:NAD(P)H-binding protein [Clostridia bacterium]